MATIAGQIRTRRLKMGLSLKRLASNADLSISTIYKVEHGHLTTRLDVLQRLSNALDITLRITPDKE